MSIAWWLSGVGLELPVSLWEQGYFGSSLLPFCSREGGKEGGQWGRRRPEALLLPGVQSKLFFPPASAAHCWWNGLVKWAELFWSRFLVNFSELKKEKQEPGHIFLNISGMVI